MHKVVVGVGFGDETKGATVDWMCATQDIKAVIRYNGGPQAAHNVVLPDGRHHTFAQFGSGTFHGVPTYLSRHMLVNPFNLLREAEGLEKVGVQNPLQKLVVSTEALMVTPFHVMANRHRERSRGDRRHGSTGQGIGETRDYAMQFPFDAPRIYDMADPAVLEMKLHRLKMYYESELEGFTASPLPNTVDMTRMYMEAHLAIRTDMTDGRWMNRWLDEGDCVFEGAQGSLLDELFGFNPHTTWSNTTIGHAMDLLGEREYETYGLTRSYHTRHGAGPFPTENFGMTLDRAPEPHNQTEELQGSWRVGALDLSLLEYGVRIAGGIRGIDKLVVSHMDYIDQWAHVTRGYTAPGDARQPWLGVDEVIGTPYTQEQSHELGSDMAKVKPLTHDVCTRDDLLRTIEDVTGVPVAVTSYGPTWKDRGFADVRTVS